MYLFVRLAPHISTVHLPSGAPSPSRAFSKPYAPCSLRASRSEPVLYEELYFSVALALNSNAEEMGTVYVAEATPDQSGANDSRSFRRLPANKIAESPNSSI